MVSLCVSQPFLSFRESNVNSSKDLPHRELLSAAGLAAADYEMLREISRGGMGVVYLVRNRRMDRLESLKVVRPALLEQPGALERFEREMRSAARLSHPNIVAAYSAPRIDGLLAFAMEYVDGVNLQQLVSEHGPLPVSNACYYAQQVAKGLQHACDRNMVHRDIKPSNLILTRDGKKQVVKILDFGLAKATSENAVEGGLTNVGQVLGTPQYMAPEQIKSSATADFRADIYSLGCTLYHLLGGAPPFHEKSSVYDLLHAHQTEEPPPLRELRRDVPEELAAIVSKMMAKDPTQRFQRPDEVAQALAPFFKSGIKPMPASAEPLALPSAESETTSRRGAQNTVIDPNLGALDASPKAIPIPLNSAGEAPLTPCAAIPAGPDAAPANVPSKLAAGTRAAAVRVCAVSTACFFMLGLLVIWACGLLQTDVNPTVPDDQPPAIADAGPAPDQQRDVPGPAPAPQFPVQAQGPLVGRSQPPTVPAARNVPPVLKRVTGNGPFAAGPKVGESKIQPPSADNVAASTKANPSEAEDAGPAPTETATDETKPVKSAETTDALQQGTVWLGEWFITTKVQRRATKSVPQKVTFTILERRGETFKALLEVGNNIMPAREVEGTIKGRKLSWLAKNVKVAQKNRGLMAPMDKASQALDSEGTITGNKIVITNGYVEKDGLTHVTGTMQLKKK